MLTEDKHMELCSDHLRYGPRRTVGGYLTDLLLSTVGGCFIGAVLGTTLFVWF